MKGDCLLHRRRLLGYKPCPARRVFQMTKVMEPRVTSDASDLIARDL